MSASSHDYHDYADAVELSYREKRARKPAAKKAAAGLVHGIVLRARGHHFDVQTLADDGAERTLLCEVRGRLLQEKGRDTLVAVGDRVWVQPLSEVRDGVAKGQIERIEPRRSVLSRQHPGVDMPAEDVILANPDQAVVVFACARPDPHLRMLDRFLVVCAANELPVTIVANKVDLVGMAEAQAKFALYARIGYPVIYASVPDRHGIAELGDLLVGRISVFTGPSGVGKSSLINAIHPELDLKIGDLRDFQDKGRHTTRSAHLIALPIGPDTFVADTPGIRELGLYDIDPSNLPFYFREMAPLLHDCRYPGCTHDHEPGCAVRAAVDAGAVDPERYDSYLRLLKGEE